MPPELPISLPRTQSHQAVPSRSSPADKSFFGRWSLFKQAGRSAPKRTGVRQAISAYNLEWEELKSYLEAEFENLELSKNMTLMDDKFVLFLPTALGDEQVQEIDDLRRAHLQNRPAASSDGPKTRTDRGSMHSA